MRSIGALLSLWCCRRHMVLCRTSFFARSLLALCCKYLSQARGVRTSPPPSSVSGLVRGVIRWETGADDSGDRRMRSDLGRIWFFSLLFSSNRLTRGRPLPPSCASQTSFICSPPCALASSACSPWVRFRRVREQTRGPGGEAAEPLPRQPRAQEGGRRTETASDTPRSPR